MTPAERDAAMIIIQKSHEIKNIIQDGDLTLAEKKAYRTSMDVLQSEWKVFENTQNGSVDTIRPIIGSL
jgi:hypothetical protein